MSRSAVAAAIAAVSLLLTACGGTSNDADGGPPESAEPVATYETQAFGLPLSVAEPSWVDDEPVDSANFVTWESADAAQPAVRFLIPVEVYPPGETEAIAPPDDYLGYLLAQEDSGATFSATGETTIGGQRATLLTATTTESLEGSLGCPTAGAPAADCFGLQPELSLRLAVLETSDHTLVAWLRHEGSPETDGAAEEFADFEAMLHSVQFLDREPTVTSPPADAGPSPVDGVWTSSFSEKELARSPLLYDAGEVNDQNWGDFTLTLDQGLFRLQVENSRESSGFAGTFEVDGKVLILSLDNLERFEMRFDVSGDTLSLERDAGLGIAPTPFVLQPWTYVSR